MHALTGVMADHNATTGVLVTTSWFGRASEQFANRNRITLINGAELKQLIKEYLHKDVTAPRGALLYSRLSREEFGGYSWV